MIFANWRLADADTIIGLDTRSSTSKNPIIIYIFSIRQSMREPVLNLELILGVAFGCLHMKRVRHRQHLYNRTQLLIMCTLEYLGNRRPFQRFKLKMRLSKNEHQNFFCLFTEKISSCKDEWINYPEDIERLRPVLKEYEDNFLPGCGGSVDVVHLK